MNVYRVERLCGEFIGLYRAMSGLEAIEKACQECGDTPWSPDFCATIVYREPVICRVASRSGVRR